MEMAKNIGSYVVIRAKHRDAANSVSCTHSRNRLVLFSPPVSPPSAFSGIFTHAGHQFLVVLLASSAGKRRRRRRLPQGCEAGTPSSLLCLSRRAGAKGETPRR